MTISWQQRPHEGDTGLPHRLIRTPHTGKLTMIITSDEVVGVYTHWWRGRTKPHHDGQCEACAASVPRRWHGYLSCLSQKGSEHFLFEFTPALLPTLEGWVRSRGSLRGGELTTYRHGSKQNGKILGVIVAGPLDPILLPREIDIPKVLLKIWEEPQKTFLPEEEEDRIQSRRAAFEKVLKNGHHRHENPPLSGVEHPR